MKTLLLILLGILLGITGSYFLLHRAPASYTNGAEPAGKQLWTCGMHPQVIQDKPGNCPICGMKLTPLTGSSSKSGSGAKTGERKILYYWDPMMNPPYISDKPGKSPMGMDLIPRYSDEVSAGAEITIDPVVVQNMGIRTAKVSEAPLRKTLRAFGRLREAETMTREFTIRVSGFVEKLYADTEGMYVAKGDPLFDLYSPELLIAQQELLRAETLSDKNLSQAAREKLLNWNVGEEEIEAVLKEKKARKTLTFRSPFQGHLHKKWVLQGASLEAGAKLYEIIDLSTIWLEVQVYEQQIPFLKLGQTAKATLRALPGKEIRGSLIFIHPGLDPESRTVMVRLAFSNPDFQLLPEMFATAEIEVELAPKAIVVPREAVIDTGKRQIVFITHDAGRFEARLVKLGPEGEGSLVQVLDGLTLGETVVTSGQFLLDTESRTREAIEKMTSASASVPKSPPAMPPMEEFDAVLFAYLDTAKALASDSEAESKAKAAKFFTVIRSFHLRAQKSELEASANELTKRSEGFEKQPIAKMRQQFKRLSDSLLSLLEKIPPSKAVGEKLFVAHCPMYPGSWLQTSESLENPYYGQEMLQCGEIQRTVPTVKK